MGYSNKLSNLIDANQIYSYHQSIQSIVHLNLMHIFQNGAQKVPRLHASTIALIPGFLFCSDRSIHSSPAPAVSVRRPFQGRPNGNLGWGLKMRCTVNRLKHLKMSSLLPICTVLQYLTFHSCPMYFSICIYLFIVYSFIYRLFTDPFNLPSLKQTWHLKMDG